MSINRVATRALGHIRAGLMLAKHHRPPRVLLFGPMSLGDDLLCTAVLHEARRRNTPFAMMTARPELFRGNHDVLQLLPHDDYYAQLLRRLGSQVVQPYYISKVDHDPARDRLPPRHIIAEMCRLAGLTGEIALRPYLHLSDAELALGTLFPRQIAIQSSCLSARIPYPTKEWGAERLAEVARALQGEFSLVQLGQPSDPPLPVDRDLRGQTSLREAGAILARSIAFIGLEGFLGHLARAVDCPAVIIHGGRAPEGIFSYGANRNFFFRPPCSPCGLRTDCPYNLACMQGISTDEVSAAVREIATAPPIRPLAVERHTIERHAVELPSGGFAPEKNGA